MITPWSCWSSRADDLAQWARARLVNRTDAWGSYRPQSEWGKEFQRRDGTTGKLGATTTIKGRLDAYYLKCHFRAKDRGAVVGLHSTSPTNTSLWGALDIDHHGPTSTAPEINWNAAQAWYGQLVQAGFHPLLIDSNGAGGFHLWVLFAEPAPTPKVFHFLQQFTADHARHGMAVCPESFPKQAILRPRPDGSPGFGNWLRAPGRHHTREHWSRVWAGGHWLDGDKAVEALLQLQGDPPGLLPDVPAPARPPLVRRPFIMPFTNDNLAARVAAYLARLPNLGEGQGRDDVAYQFAAFLVRDLALADAIALEWLDRWDAGNNPPKGTERLLEILKSAHAYGRHAIGSGLGSVSIRRKDRGHAILSFEMEVR